MLQKQEKRTFRQKLTHKYRLVILNEDSFEERVSFKLTRLNVFIFSGLFSILLISCTTLLIAFTPIKEYIPGYSSTALKKQATNLIYKADSLEVKIKHLQSFTKALKPILAGTISGENVDAEFINSIADKTIEYDEADLKSTKADSLFREEVEREDRYSLFEQAQRKIEIVFFAPVSGIITDNYDNNRKHFAIDIAVKKGTPVKAVADGTVLFSEWTAETGYVMILKHPSDFISVYKHNEILYKEQGDLVTSGEVIAAVGSTGKFSTGPHLHFELWSEGYPVNPVNFIDFE